MKSVTWKPVVEMTPTLSEVPFAMWGIDLVGQFVKLANKYKDVVVAVDYFNKWVEAIPLRNTTAEEIEDFIWKKIISRYGIRRYWTTPSNATGETPFSLVFRTEVVLPVELRGRREFSNKAIKHTWHIIYLKKYYV
ncbi:hypothetical protein LIER_38656 [Lithospermum erythrorhizon]|uniref:Uncharacterized protein n=1 Tax=Lithospermum erythrorhizon TaxID=34254 RepID=A0AAV3Q7N6_LITER